MPIDLAELVRPESTALVTMELQRGVVGDLSTLPELREAAEQVGLIDNVASLLAAARPAGVTVVHCVVAWRADRRGTALTTPIAAALARRPEQILDGTAAVELPAALGPAPSDLISRRRHGLTPVMGTDLDAALRAEGVSTVVCTGVSLNLGVLGLVLGLADLGYRLVVPTDAVVGVPVAYGEQVLAHTIAPVARLCRSADLPPLWPAAAPPPPDLPPGI